MLPVQLWRKVKDSGDTSTLVNSPSHLSPAFSQSLPPPHFQQTQVHHTSTSTHKYVHMHTHTHTHTSTCTQSPTVYCLYLRFPSLKLMSTLILTVRVSHPITHSAVQSLQTHICTTEVKLLTTAVHIKQRTKLASKFTVTNGYLM